MEMPEKVRAVEEVFERLDADIAGFQQWSGLGCKWGCGKCCFKADIEASTLEFLPFAWHLHEQGLAFEWLEKLRVHEDPLCLILDPQQNGAGLCSEYRHRGLICRLFGFSARVNKYGAKELVTCQIIKTEQAKAFTNATDSIGNGANVPVMSQYYMQLHSIDHQMAQEFFPINVAIRHALEAILHYHAYRT